MTRLDVAGPRTGAAIGDLIVIISVIALGSALVYPRIAQGIFEDRLDQAVADVEVVRSAAASYFDLNLDWPEAAPAGEASSQLAVSLPAGFEFTTTHYTLQWERWEVLDVIVEAAPTQAELREPSGTPEEEEVDIPDGTPALFTSHSLGVVSVRSADPALLAGLFQQYGSTSSFVRDSTWTLVISRR